MSIERYAKRLLSVMPFVTPQKKSGAGKEAKEEHVVKIDIKPHELVLPFCRNETHGS